MYTKSIILPLDVDGTIYVLQDDKGTIIGTGTREVCEVLVHIINSQASSAEHREAPPETLPRANVRAAIVI